jgi:lycopene beta-cyclase
VVDARGPAAALVPKGTGYQKFLGLELSVDPQEELREPILMDACLPQHDGFRFMYVLPFAPDRVLVEETFFSEGPRLDDASSERAILAYAGGLGLRVRGPIRRERGVLPMPWSAPPPPLPEGPICAGFRGGYFHPVTGYSFPLAVRFALALADSHPAPLARDSRLRQFSRNHERQLGFLFALTRMMFTGFAPEQRFQVLEHFYRLPEPLIERFYAAQLGMLDRARLFWGAPPRGLSLRRVLALHPEVSP